MRKHTQAKASTGALALAASVLVAATTARAEMPKEGEFSATYCFAGNLTTLAQSKRDLEYDFELTRPMRDETPGSLLDMISVQWVGMGEVREGKRSSIHPCHFMDHDGDKVFARTWFGA
ncbi:MAG: hypothetical protein P1P84_24895 [Deferrisomatales bacterium]|nr:hypothetical protein [Deferrisomatales bacterium]